jgi:uncharacterized protein YqgC (DUF456 family)
MNLINILLTIICFVGLIFTENPVIKAIFFIFIAFEYISHMFFLRLYSFSYQRCLFVINTLLKNKNVDLFN